MLHAIKSRDQVSGDWVARCGLKGSHDRGKAPLSTPKAGERFTMNGGVQFETALHEADVNCPGCRLQVSEIGMKVLRAMAKLGDAYLRTAPSFSINANKRPVVIYAPGPELAQLASFGLTKVTGLTANLTVRGRSLAQGSKP